MHTLLRRFSVVKAAPAAAARKSCRGDVERDRCGRQRARQAVACAQLGVPPHLADSLLVAAGERVAAQPGINLLGPRAMLVSHTHQRIDVAVADRLNDQVMLRAEL
jgi:hypothetical protein